VRRRADHQRHATADPRRRDYFKPDFFNVIGALLSVAAAPAKVG